MCIFNLPLHISRDLQGVPKNDLYGFLRHTGCYFPKLFLNSKISCISTSLKKEIGIPSLREKKFQADLAKLLKINFFCYLLLMISFLSVFVVDLTF